MKKKDKFSILGCLNPQKSTAEALFTALLPLLA